MKRIIASIATAGVFIAGAFAVSTIAPSEAAAQAVPEATAASEERPITAAKDGIRPHPSRILAGVLAELVEDGTLTQSQSDAVTDALATKKQDLKDTRDERRETRREHRAMIEAWLEDGVISADEIASAVGELPFLEHTALADALEDGEITQAEWDAFIAERKADRPRRGRR